MTPSDAKIWAVLVREALRLNGGVGVRDGCPRGLYRAMQKATGRRKGSRDAAVIPFEHRHVKSCYVRLIRLVRDSVNHDAAWRQTVLDLAHQVAADLKERGVLANVGPAETGPGGALSASDGSSEKRRRGASWRDRKDING